MPKQHEHKEEKGDCPICGIEFDHRHLDVTKPKEFISQGVKMKRSMNNMPSDKSSILSAIIQAVERSMIYVENINPLEPGQEFVDANLFLQALKEEMEKE